MAPATIVYNSGNSTVDTLTLIDSGAEGEFIDRDYARSIGIELRKLKQPIKPRNVDGTLNSTGTITHYAKVELTINERISEETLYVTGLGRNTTILGSSWLKKRNPDINWQTGTLTWRCEGNQLNLVTPDLFEQRPTINQWASYEPTIEEVDDEDEWMNGPINGSSELDDFNECVLRYIGTDESLSDIWINATVKPSQEFILKYESEEKMTTTERIPEEYHDYLDVFQEEVERFPEPRPWDHAIDMKPGFEPKTFKSYNLTPEEREQQELFIMENLKKGYIRPSKSPMASPFFFVSKKDGRLRPTQDYRYLNNWTVKNAYPLPLISEIMDKIKASGAKYFTKLDVRWGFNNIRIKEGDQWKAAFKTNLGLFEPTVMFFGLCNSPATFQNMMNDILKDEINDGWVIVYMDDILIFSKDKKSLEEMTKRVLQRLRENDLYLKPAKCQFCQTKIEYLGLIIEEGKMSMDPTKLSGIRDWPTPESVKQVRSFLGFGNFY